MFIILMLVTAVVSIFAADLALKPSSTAVAGSPTFLLDRRVLRLIRMAALAGFLALSAGLLAAYSSPGANPLGETLGALFTVLEYIQWVPLWGVGLYAVLLLCGAKNKRAALLFSLSIPGAVALPTLFIGLFGGKDGNVAVLPIVMVLIYPATWILPFIAMMQAMQLGFPKREIDWTGYVCAFLIAGVYLWTGIVTDSLNSMPPL
jgi:hypothetical protein